MLNSLLKKERVGARVWEVRKAPGRCQQPPSNASAPTRFLYAPLFWRRGKGGYDYHSPYSVSDYLSSSPY
jgi:hypothetical protein